MLFDRPYIMGILNITPDSFYDGGCYIAIDTALKQVDQMVKDGADIIDIGGESTRPGADPVSVDQELKRVIPVIQAIRAHFPKVILSIDTTKSIVMEQALNAGINMINDISGLLFDPRSEDVVKSSGVPVIIMHAPWRPKTMQQVFRYKRSIIDELRGYFEQRIEHLTGIGIPQHDIIIDPGIGFGKSAAQNYEIINHIGCFKDLDTPILLGASNKSYLKTDEGFSPKERKEGNTLTEFIALNQGVDILRVHDVAATRRTLKFALLFSEKSVK